MKQFLAKRWFLLLLLSGITLAGIWPEVVSPVTRRLAPDWVVAAALLLMAWSLESRSVWQTLLRPWPALWAAVISYGLVPLLGWGLGRLLSNPDFRIGLLISASVPCTLASAVLWTRMAGGNEATALLVILLTTGSSWLITPAWLAWGTGTLAEIHTPEMRAKLAFVLVLPVGLGQFLRSRPALARFAFRGKNPLGIVAQLLIFSIILQAAVEAGVRLRAESAGLEVGSLVFGGLLCVGVHLIALVTGLWSSRGLGFDRADQIAVAFAGSQKTLPVALLLFGTYFKQYPLAIVPMLCYHAGQLIADTFIADGLAHWSRRAAVPRTEP